MKRENQAGYFPNLSRLSFSLGVPTLTGFLNFCATFPGYAVMAALGIAPDPQPVPKTVITYPGIPGVTYAPVNSSSNTTSPVNISQTPDRTLVADPWSICSRANMGITTPTHFALYATTASVILYFVYALLVVAGTFCGKKEPRIIQETAFQWFRIALVTNVIAGPISGGIAAFIRCMPIYNAGQWMGTTFFGQLIFLTMAGLMIFAKWSASCCFDAPEEKKEGLQINTGNALSPHSTPPNGQSPSHIQINMLSGDDPARRLSIGSQQSLVHGHSDEIHPDESWSHRNLITFQRSSPGPASVSPHHLSNRHTITTPPTVTRDNFFPRNATVEFTGTEIQTAESQMPKSSSRGHHRSDTQETKQYAEEKENTPPGRIESPH